MSLVFNRQHTTCPISSLGALFCSPASGGSGVVSSTIGVLSFVTEVHADAAALAPKVVHTASCRL